MGAGHARQCSPRGDGGSATAGSPSPLLRRWFVANATLAGLLSLAWLLLRSGTRPSRLAYPRAASSGNGFFAAAPGAPPGA